MSMLTRMLIPRSVRRAAHPGRAVKRAVTPRVVKRARHAMHPVSNAKYSVERSLNTKRRPVRRRPVTRTPAMFLMGVVIGFALFAINPWLVLAWCVFCGVMIAVSR